MLGKSSGAGLSMPSTLPTAVTNRCAASLLQRRRAYRRSPAHPSSRGSCHDELIATAPLFEHVGAGADRLFDNLAGAARLFQIVGAVDGKGREGDLGQESDIRETQGKRTVRSSTASIFRNSPP